jgi:hypothetical protein
MVLYDRDLGIGSPQLEGILEKYRPRLNPLDVVLRSVVNRLAENLSEEYLAPSHHIAFPNAHFRDMAIKEVVRKAESDKDFD